MANLLRATGLAAVLALAAAGCSSDGGGSDPATDGPRARAVEQLRDLGLTEEQAACVTDELGAETVVEATDLNALAQGQPYRDAADTCIADG